MAWVIKHKPTGLRLKREGSLWFTVHRANNRETVRQVLTPGVGRLYGTVKGASAVKKVLHPMDDWDIVPA